MKAEMWSEMKVEEREKVSNLISEFSTAVVSWNDQEQENVLQIYSKIMKDCQEVHQIKPHQLVVIAKMLQEAAVSDLYEWLPEDYEKWEDKDELLAMFFFGEKGLESYRQEKKKAN